MTDTFSRADLATVLAAFEASPFRALKLTCPGCRLEAKRGGSTLPSEGIPTVVLTAPTVGTVAQLCALGADLAAGSHICAIRWWDGTLSPVTADRNGTIVSVLVTEGSFVGYGQHLVRLRPAIESVAA